MAGSPKQIDHKLIGRSTAFVSTPAAWAGDPWPHASPRQLTPHGPALSPGCVAPAHLAFRVPHEGRSRTPAETVNTVHGDPFTHDTKGNATEGNRDKLDFIKI